MTTAEALLETDQPHTHNVIHTKCNGRTIHKIP